MKIFLNGWFRLTTPRIVSPTTLTTPTGRERQRYARLISGFTLFLLLLTLLTIPLRLFNQDISRASIGLMGDILFLLALITNRRGWLLAAGICCVSGTMMSEMTALVTQPGGLDTPQVVLFDYLAIGILFAGALLPPQTVFVVAFLNGLIIFLCLTLLPQTPALGAVVKGSFSTIFVPALVFQLVIAFATFIIIRSLLAAIRRADRAEEIASLQTMIAEHERRRASEKQQLEESIRQIAAVHAQIANGNFQARVNLYEGNVLWSIAGQLNTLLARVHIWRQEAEMFRRTQDVSSEVAQRLHQARMYQSPIHFRQPTGTPLDSVLQEINLL